MKQAVAKAILSFTVVACAYVIGAGIRGPLADENPLKDLAIGGLVLGAAAVINWAAAELETAEAT